MKYYITYLTGSTIFIISLAIFLFWLEGYDFVRGPAASNLVGIILFTCAFNGIISAIVFSLHDEKEKCDDLNAYYLKTYYEEHDSEY